MNLQINEHQPQAQDNALKDINISGDFTFSPVQIGTKIETQIIQISAAKVTQQTLIKSSPYQGLKRFNVKDRERFFGRDKLIARLFDAVNNSSLNLVLGSSGSGKSSVVRAGVIPELKKSLESKRFYDFIFTPNHNPFESFYRCLLNQEKDYHFTESEVEIVRKAEANTLPQIITNLKKGEERWLIFIDQFEELFTSCHDIEIRKKFIEGIVRVANRSDSSVRIVLAMRSDFLEQFSFHPNLAEIVNQQNNIHLVTEMYPDELRQAIEQPAAKHGVIFEEGLVEQIIKDVEGQSGYLPLLQYTLNLLWERERTTIGSDGRTCIEDRVLNRASYAELEGVRGALQKRVNEIYQALPQDEQEATKKIFVKLVNIVDTESGSKVVSRRAYHNEFTGELIQKTIDKFVDEKLLISSNEYSSKSKLIIAGIKNIKDAATVEIAHEILLYSWDILRKWIEEEKEAIILKNWLAGETKRWQRIRLKNESRARDELLKGSRLEQIVEFRTKETFKNIGGLNQDENEFINASVAWQEQVVKREKRQLLILRSLLAGVSTAFLLAVGTTAYAFQQATIAGLGEQAAQARLIKPIDGLVRAIKLTGESQDKLREVTRSVQSTLADLLKVPVESNIFTGHKQNVTSVAFSLVEGYIASSSEDKTVRLWDIEGNLIAKPFKGHEDYVNSVAFSPDERYIVTGSHDKTVRLWDLQGNPIAQPFNGHEGVVRVVTFSRDGKYVLSAGDDGMRLWDLNGKLIQNFLESKGQRINSVAFSPDGQTIASAGSERVQFWDIKGKPIDKPIKVHVYAVNSVAFSPDGKYIVTSGTDGRVRLVELKTKTISKTFVESDLHINSVAFSPDSKYIVIGSGKTVRVRDLEGNLQGQPFLGHEDTITSVAFSPNGNYIVTGSWDKTLRLWDFRNLTAKLPGQEDYKALLRVGCNKLISHPVLVIAKTEEAKAASKTCHKEAWSKANTSRFLVNQGKAIARQGNVEEAIASFKQAQKLNYDLNINDLEAQAQRLAAIAASENEQQNNTSLTVPNLPNQAKYGQVTLSQFSLNNKGNVISVAPGEIISASANYFYDCPECQQGSINQIIVGIAGENSAQACIYNGSIQESGSSKFTLTAPSEPGVYHIRFRYAQAFSCEQGALGWWRVDGEPTAEANIGAIIVQRK